MQKQNKEKIRKLQWRSKQKLKKVSEDVLKRIVEAIEELEKTHKNLLRKYFDLGRWIDLAVEEGASYRDIADALADKQIYGYSDRSLRRAHKFYRYVVENHGGDVEACIAWLEDKYPEVKVELIDIITSKKPRKEPELPAAESGEGFEELEEEEDDSWYIEEVEKPGKVEQPEKPSWMLYREELAKRKPPNWRNLGPKASKEDRMIRMIDYEIWEFHDHLVTLLMRERIPEDYISKIRAAVEDALLRLKRRLFEEWKEIEKEAMAA